MEFRFSRADGESNTVPASLLIQMLEGAQRAIWLIAFAKEQRGILSRVRIPFELEQRYQLECEVPKAGSFLVPTFLASVQPQLSPAAVTEVAKTFQGVAAALAEQDRDAVALAISDSAVRRRVVNEFEKLAPKRGSGWRLAFE